jgi:hypothetical protein
MNKVDSLMQPTIPVLPGTHSPAANRSGLTQIQSSPALWSTAVLLQELQTLANTGAPAESSIGTSVSALTDTETRLPDAGGMPYYVQHGNACGTTTLAEIMSYLGVPESQSDVDSAIRRMNVFTAPDDMIQFARDHGLEAEGYNNGSWDQIKSMIDNGCPVQAMVDGDDSVKVNDGTSNFSVSGLHYIAITGYGKDPATGEEYVIYHDPNRNTEQKMSVADFEKMWSGVPGGFHNYFIAYGRPGANLPPGNSDGIQGTLGTLSGVTNLTNGINRIFCPDSFGGFLHGLAETYGGVFQTVGCGIGGLFQLGANWLNNAVCGIPVLENIVQPFGDLVNGFGAMVGDVFNGFGKACNDAGSAVEDLFNGDFGCAAKKAGDAVSDVVGGVGSAISDGVSAVGSAISDVFSGW